MPRKPSPTLTDAELRLMEVLWDRGRATVAEVADAMPKRAKLAYNTVLTTLGILERKGYVNHTKEGRAFVYEPRVDREDAQHQALKNVLRRFFNDSPEALVVSLIEKEELDADELDRLRRELEE